jgi:hypothetical protein
MAVSGGLAARGSRAKGRVLRQGAAATAYLPNKLMASSASTPPVIEIGATPRARPTTLEKAEAGHIGSARYSGNLLPPSPPADKTTALALAA